MHYLLYKTLYNKKDYSNVTYSSLLQFNELFKITIILKHLLIDTTKKIKNDTNTSEHKSDTSKFARQLYSFLSPESIKNYRLGNLFHLIDRPFEYHDNIIKLAKEKNIENLLDFSEYKEKFTDELKYINNKYLRFYWFVNHYKNYTYYEFNKEYILLLKSTRRFFHDLEHLISMDKESLKFFGDFEDSIKRAERLTKLNGVSDFIDNWKKNSDFVNDLNIKNCKTLEKLNIDIPYDEIPF